MKKTFMFILIFLLMISISGCGNKKEPSQISCKYKEVTGDFAVNVEMLFKRDNKKKLVTSGQLIMSYDLGESNLSDIQSQESDENSVDGILGGFFDTVCDNIGANYTNCEIVETEKEISYLSSFECGTNYTTKGFKHITYFILK